MVPRESYPVKIRREIIWFLKSPFQWFIFLNLWKTPKQSTFFWFQFPLINIPLWIGVAQFSRMTLKKVWKTVFLTLIGGGSFLILTGSRKYMFFIVIFLEIVSLRANRSEKDLKLTICAHASVKCAHRLYVNFWIKNVSFKIQKSPNRVDGTGLLLLLSQWYFETKPGIHEVFNWLN